MQQYTPKNPLINLNIVLQLYTLRKSLSPLTTDP